MQIEITKSGKVTVYNDDGTPMKGVKSGRVEFSHDGATEITVTALNIVDGHPAAMRGVSSSPINQAKQDSED